MASHDRPRPAAPVQLPRRTLVAAGAWTVPVVAAATAAPAYAASPCMTLYDYTLNWATASYTRNTTGLSAYAALTSTQAGGDPLWVHFTSVAASAGSNIDTARNLKVSNEGSAATSTTQDPYVTNLGNTGQSGIRLQHNARASGIANAQNLTISFRTGASTSSPLVYVRNVSFYMTDIDGLNGGNNYADRVSLSPNPNLTTPEQVRDQNTTAAVSGGGTATVSIVGTGMDTEPWKLVTGNASSTTQSYNNIAETSAGTRVRVTYANTGARVMQELLLKYWTADTATIYHRMYITNITFKARLIACG